MKNEQHSVCGECGATIYREHLDSGIARYEGSKLLCSFCVAEFEKAHDASGTQTGMGLDTISLQDDDDDTTPEPAKTKFRVSNVGLLGESGAWTESRFKRSLDPVSAGATRCRTFHSKLNEGSIDFMTRQINDWLDANEQIVIKFAASTIGVFEGKHAEPNLILTLFY
jgi:hypothetical protein